ncbi:unnamed protein product [marine sediment metagenome]|uniref:Radical SAM core domain-containing protein n=1 Tax=marine sediment metagenome TaxID=412755 RepID=X1LKN1_9ZZZZ
MLIEMIFKLFIIVGGIIFLFITFGFVKELILAKKLLRESTLEKGLDKKELPIDYITFSGLAEPTLAENLSELVKVVHQNMSQPVAILTNSSLMTREDVLRDLLLFDVVVVKIDAPTEILFKKINRPFVNYGKVFGLIGGFHGFKEFHLITDISFIMPCHCTRYKKDLAKLFPQKYIENGIGKEIKF